MLSNGQTRPWHSATYLQPKKHNQQLVHANKNQGTYVTDGEQTNNLGMYDRRLTRGDKNTQCRVSVSRK
jgi:hypothetical protein